MKLFVVLPVLLVAACTVTVRSAEPPAQNVPAGPEPDSAAAICSVAMPDEWSRRIREGEVGGGRGTVVATSADASTMFVKRPKSLHVLTGGSAREIMKVDEGEFVGFDFDGRWLTFGVGHSPGNLADWTAYAWDSKSAEEPIEIGDNPELRGGPLFHTFVRHGKAAWVIGGDLHLFDLAAKRDEVVAQAVTRNPVFFGDLLVWQDHTDTLRAISAVDGKNAEVPAPIRAAGQNAFMSADDTTFAWITGDTLFGWRVEWPRARRVAEVGVAQNRMRSPHVSGDLVSWSADEPFVTDVRSGATTTAGHWLEVNGSALTAQLGGPQVSSPAAVAVSALPPLPGC